MRSNAARSDGIRDAVQERKIALPRRGIARRFGGMRFWRTLKKCVLGSAAVTVAFAMVGGTGCAGSGPGRSPAELQKLAANALGSGVQCSASRPSTKPDLFGWDASSRGEIAAQASQGIVVVKYEKRGCDVQLTVLGNCSSKKAAYGYLPYTESRRLMAEDEASLFANFPLVASLYRARVQAGVGLRADFRLAGIESLPVGTKIESGDLVGDCDGATHVVRAIHRGVFAMGAGETIKIAAGGSLLEAAVSHKAEILDSAGTPSACSDNGKLNPGCDIPLRLELLALASDKSAPVVAAPVGGLDSDLKSANDSVEAAKAKRKGLEDSWGRVAKLASDNTVPLDTRLSVLEKFEAAATDAPDLADRAARTREQISLGSTVLGTDWFSIAVVTPAIGGRLEGPRFRWKNFQLSSAVGYLAVGPQLGADGQDFGQFLTGGGGFLGVGAKTAIDDANRHEFGFLAYPLFVGAVKAQEPSGVETFAYGSITTYRTFNVVQIGLLNPHYTYRFDAIKLEVGVQLPIFWYRIATNTGPYQALIPAQLYGGVGF